MDCRDSALFSGVDEASCENMLRCFSAYEQRFTSGQTILTCGQQQDMIGVLLSAALESFVPQGIIERALTGAWALPLATIMGGCLHSDVFSILPIVQTAYAYGIINGVSEAAFAPNDSITREQVCVMLTRAARLCGADTAMTPAAVRDALAVYTDYRSIGTWAQEEAAFCVASGIYAPQTAAFEPACAFSRAEMAASLFSLLNFANLL